MRSEWRNSAGVCSGCRALHGFGTRHGLRDILNDPEALIAKLTGQQCVDPQRKDSPEIVVVKPVAVPRRTPGQMSLCF